MNSLETVVSIIAGVIAIIGGIYVFIQWIRRKVWQSPSGLFLKDGNIYLVYPSGDKKQITFMNSDSKAILGKKKVIFFRGEQINDAKIRYTRYKLMSSDINTLRETIVTDQKPFADGSDNSFEILSPNYPNLSIDQSKLFFTIEKYATGSQLVQIDLKSGRWVELFPVDNFEFIIAGKYKNNLLVRRSETKDRGRDVYFQICDHYGKVLLEFEDYASYMKFRSDSIVRE